ncbi:putative protein [Jejuia pallidilutea]|uniref:FAD-dependent oxidoreductase 2 FAD-binding domain-containing protein n=1 Tax=Jejuia pallidilutea TaxID=504487 RepID=A0A090W549_9FLAO|nr:putative protein [Jejuia pallidilutea]GAL70564.1 putative protein [Jejuia pallidilutea]
MHDVLIIGGGAAGMSCALVLGSAKEKPFAKDKQIAIITHQKHRIYKPLCLIMF